MKAKYVQCYQLPVAAEHQWFEQWYGSCERREGLLKQLSGAEQEALKQKQFSNIMKDLSLQNNKLVLVVI